MAFVILLLVHVAGATVGLLSGFLAMILRKGSGLHGAAGTVFFVSMLAMSGSAVYIAAFLSPVAINVVAGLLTLYLVSTSWRAARAKELVAGPVDLAALLFALAVGALGIGYGLEAAGSPTGGKDGITAPIYVIFGTIALLFGASDVRLIVRRRLTGAPRIGRHLLRMCLALLIATLSLYPGQAKLFPMWLRETNLLFVPHILLLGSMLFWTVRMGRRRRAEARPEERMDTMAGGTARA
ncbi:MAG: hypothetical protein ACSLFQ_12235 [Thermoanaerobaculia bacterium]